MRRQFEKINKPRQKQQQNRCQNDFLSIFFMSRNANSTSVTSSTTSLSSVWSRAITAKSSWPDKEEFLDVIYWFRQVLGVFLGLIWGLSAFSGAIGLVTFALINAGLLYVYFAAFQCVDEEEFGGAWELTKEGFMTSFASFLVVWIILYSGLHFE